MESILMLVTLLFGLLGFLLLPLRCPSCGHLTLRTRPYSYLASFGHMPAQPTDHRFWVHGSYRQCTHCAHLAYDQVSSISPADPEEG